MVLSFIARFIFALAILVLLANSGFAAPPPPTSLVIIACRVDDVAGQARRIDPSFAPAGLRDLEWHLEGNELQCKREVLPLQDAVTMHYLQAKPLSSNFAELGQCARAAMEVSPRWNNDHRNWAVLKVGCPVPIVNGDGKIVGWKLPECPNSIRCKFDESVI